MLQVSNLKAVTSSRIIVRGICWVDIAFTTLLSKQNVYGECFWATLFYLSQVLVEFIFVKLLYIYVKLF